MNLLLAHFPFIEWIFAYEQLMFNIRINALRDGVQIHLTANPLMSFKTSAPLGRPTVKMSIPPPNHWVSGLDTCSIKEKNLGVGAQLRLSDALVLRVQPYPKIFKARNFKSFYETSNTVLTTSAIHL